MIHTSQIEDMDEISKQFYTKNSSSNEKIILAMEWYNQSFLRYSIRDIAGRLVDIATAFETLFQLPKHNKTEEFKKNIREYLQVKEGSVIDEWAGDFYFKVRSETVHRGKPLSYLFKHPDAQIPHLGFFWSAQRIFRECISVKAGLPRHTNNDRLIEELIPNEVHLNTLRKAGSFKKIIANNLLGEIDKLRRIYPVGKREDIIWLGKELLKVYKKLCPSELKYLPTLELILGSQDTDSHLGLKYYQFHTEFKANYIKRC